MASYFDHRVPIARQTRPCVVSAVALAAAVLMLWAVAASKSLSGATLLHAAVSRPLRAPALRHPDILRYRQNVAVGSNPEFPVLVAQSQTPFTSTSKSSSSVVPHFLVGIAGCLVGLFAIVKTVRSWSTRSVHQTDTAITAVSGERFDPLEIHKPQPLSKAESLHGQISLGAVLTSGVLVATIFATHPALASGLDFGFNDDFDVDFEGFRVDHRILVDVIVAGQFIGFIGALIGGYSARQRGREVEELASKLKQVNRQLRQQARRQKEGLYTPIELVAPTSSAEVSEISDLVAHLRVGKKRLRDGEATAALHSFEQALAAIDKTSDLPDALKFKRKAWRGIGGAQVQLGQPEPALVAMQHVLDLTKHIGDKTGMCDAYGVIADIYTDLNKLDKAAEYYDLYIGSMEQDQSSDAV